MLVANATRHDNRVDRRKWTVGTQQLMHINFDDNLIRRVHLMGNLKERRRRGNRTGQAGRDQASNREPEPSTTGGHEKDLSNRQSRNTAIPYKQTYKPHSTLLVQFTEETPTWYDCGRNTAGRDDTIHSMEKSKSGPQTNQNNTRDIILKYRQQADEIYNQEVLLSRNGTAGGASYSEKDDKWVENTMKKGTLKDRIAAMSVVVGMDCMHKLYALDMLLDLVGCGLGGIDAGSVPNSRVGQMASEALSDLFVNTLLPKDRKLFSLESRPLFLYEGNRNLSPRVLLLWRFEEMIKWRFASYITRYLGRTLAGDDELSKKSALTTASSLLMQVPEGEDALLAMIVNKIGDPGKKIASAAGHQLRLILQEHPVMVNVVAREVQQLAHRPHLSPRALYNCVVFLNQLQLARDDDDESAHEELQNGKKNYTPASLPASLINTYFHLFEMAIKKNEGVKKDSKKILSTKDSSSSGMKSRLLSALLTGVNRAHPYLPSKDAVMEQHIDTLYRISHTASPSSATQALMLLYQLAVGPGENRADTSTVDDETRTMRKDRFYRALYAKLGDSEMFSGRQITLFFNLLYKAMKHDTCTERITAFSKRLLYSVLHLSSSVACGALFLFSEIIRIRPELLRREPLASGNNATFDPSKREPRAAFSGKVAGLNSLWELSLLAHHFHPSVNKFTTDSHGTIAFKGDPLKDFALSAFLDKFAFRNPKSLEKLTKQLKRGQSIAERKSGLSGITALPLNDPSYLELRGIAVEDNFFQKFFIERAKRDELKGVTRGNVAQKDADSSDPEDKALDAAEADAMIDDFEGDTDSEEEAFVNQLAEKMMESGGNGKVNYDEEDPDMEDWDDFDDDDDNDDNDGRGDEDVNSEEEKMDTNRNFIDDAVSIDSEDAFMDDASSDDKYDDDDDDAYADKFDLVNGGDFGERSSSSDDEPDLPAELLDAGDSDDASFAEESANKVNGKRQRKRKNQTSTSVFADADEYEQLLNEEMKNKKHK